MLRPIPEDESDHGAILQASLDSISAAADAASLDGNGPSRSVISAASAVLADGRDDDPESKDGLIKPKRKRRRRSRRWAYWRSLLVMGIVVVAAVVIVVVILVTTDGSVEEEAETVTTDQTATLAPNQAPVATTPTVAPTIDPDTLSTLDALVGDILVAGQKLDSSQPQVENILEEARTKAKDWILTKDLLRDEILADPTLVRFTQRYVLVLLMYSMQLNNGDVESIEEEILAAEETECSWSGIFCDDAIVEQTNITTIQLPVIRRIHWGGQSAIGALPPEVRSLVYLQEFNVSFNDLQGPIPTEWFDTPPPRNTTVLVPEVELQYYLPYLYLVDVGFNNLDGSVPLGFWSCPSLRFVYLSNNVFTGQALPSEEYLKDAESISSPFLEDIWIDNNSLTGGIPRWIFSLANLKSFIAERNLLDGTLPDLDNVVGGLPATMQVLDLSFNNMTGFLPAALFEGDGLNYLYLDNNQFNGKLPTYEPPEIPVLVDVWLHNNQLTGKIPDAFGADWSNLAEFRLQTNQLTGTVVSGCLEPLRWMENPLVEADCLNGSPVECVCCGSNCL
mmetsp:Transcript_12019/g.33236  ORF Transcript_12019/g.33236 Transcript_12019/m.33236 type:complete len:563 (-) Transcript_12019:89-1777(-)